ncbi:unnamed protein product [Pieris macdunnoughi]|uniref:Integrase catalytic domain-containing protein n=1 Tax=Pieris macdunnoughi TaxID=345717 RepID=A0A821QWH6_9NEOP|nr:unnamed protein product [Pieris macdunnoughi]
MSRLTVIEENTASGSHVPSSVRCSTPPIDKNNVSATKAFVDALGMLTRPKPNNYYVSNFDPAVNNFGVWCDEVERAIRANHWDDHECFSRVANCLRGDAKAWLNEWATNERSWSNFVKEFRSLCPQKVNAQILHEVINSTSEKFLSYAEYARRSLLRLRLVKGLSEELMVQIVIFGISDVQVRAAATNADLTTENLVSFLATAPRQPITSWEKSDVPFNTIHVDALGPLPESNGYKFVLILVDSFTKFCLLYPMYRQDTNELKRVFDSAISLFGTPKLIVCDRGRMFDASAFTSWVSEMGCDIHYVTPEMHHSNGQAERYVRTVLNLLRIESNNKASTWSNALGKVQLVLNVTKQKTTQYSALYLLIGTHAATPVIRALVRDVAIDNSSPNREALRELSRSSAKASLDRNRDRQNARVNRRRHPPKRFQVNDQVFVIKYTQSTGKLDPGMRGPYRVIKVLPSDRYELRLLSGSRGKRTQAAAQYMIPWKGEWCPESCAAFFESKFQPCY